CRSDKDCIHTVCPAVCRPQPRGRCITPKPACIDGRCTCFPNSQFQCRTPLHCKHMRCPLVCAPQGNGKCITPKPVCENGKCTCSIKRKKKGKIELLPQNQ
ncbi:MAG: hypothetical protein ACK4NF_07075, partial [Planctomycetota bacterium]